MLFGILEDMGKEVYMAVYEHLGATACRILVPGYSEIYLVEDLISVAFIKRQKPKSNGNGYARDKTSPLFLIIDCYRQISLWHANSSYFNSG